MRTRKIGRASCREEARSLCDWSSDVCSSDLFEVFQELEAAAAGHRDVEHDGVPRLFPRELERFFGAGDLSDRNRGSLLFQDIPQPLPHNRVIVTNEDSQDRKSVV